MKLCVVTYIFLFLASIGTAVAENFDYEFDANFRALYGYTHPADEFKPNQKRNRFPLFASVNNKLSYEYDDVSFNIYANLKATASNSVENLNQGHWGEEIYVSVFSDYGDFYLGQMENAASQLSVTNSDLSIWQISAMEITDFIENPNWQQKNKTKYYATLVSTTPNTDGSSFKVSYLTPEYKNTTLGFSYTPENNATDSLISKFSSYSGNGAYSLALYNYHDFDYFETDFYASFSDYENSHQEYGVGFSAYRKGWSIFASYLKSKTSSSDKPINEVAKSENQKAYFDDFRSSTAYNFGISYEFAFFTSTLSYFDSYSHNTEAYNRIVNLHNSIKFDKNYAVYLGCAYATFKPAEQTEKANKGFSAYTGIQFEF